ncbi:MAG TPA: hypothetical protein VMW24_16700, partial [Sedimentisphaerales bacterium]|nr:hypothetical protein [Sedimentisphaerales bacterium]
VIMGWMRSGMTEKSIAKTLGVGVSTWEHYKATKPEFREQIRKGQQDIAALCVNNLWKRAKGYDYEETTVETIKEKNEQGKMVIVKTNTKTVTKHMAPDVGANIFLACNRDPEHWQNTQHIQHSGALTNSLSDEDCQKIRGILKAKGENGNGNNNHDHSEPGDTGDDESQPEPAQQ